MKICFLTSSYPLWPGHFKGHFVREAAVKLVEQGFLVTVIAPSEFDSIPYEIDKGVEVHRFKYFPIKKMQCLTSGNGILPNIKNNWISMTQIPFFFSSFLYHSSSVSRGHEVIHAHWSVSGLPALWCRNKWKVPIILSLRGSDYSVKGNRIINYFSNSIVRRVDGIIAENNRLYHSALKAGFPCNRILTLRNGVNLNQFFPKRDRSVLSGTHAEFADKIILFVGRLTQVKGPDIALYAFEKVLFAHPDTCLVMVGDGEMKESLIRYVKRSRLLKNRVIFVGEILTAMVSKYYNASDILIISSRSEGTPNVLLEAFSSGLTVVSVPVGGVPEVIRHEENGIMASDIDATALSESIIRALNDRYLCQRLGEAARRYAEENLSWKKTIEKYILMYQSVTNKADSRL